MTDVDDVTPHATRRSVLGAAAWSAPVVVAAATAPAYAASGSRSLSITRELDLKNGLPDGGDFRHDVFNAGPTRTEALRATVTITAARADQWGASPTAQVYDYWTYLGVSGTGATRTFAFLLVEQLGDGQGRTLDIIVKSGAGPLTPGTRSAALYDSDGSTASYGPEQFIDFADPSLRRPAPR